MNQRAGLGTRIIFKCSTEECSNSSANGFHTTSKIGKTYKINQQSIIAARLIGKGRQGLLKFSSVCGLSKPVSRPVYSEQNKILEKKSEEVKDISLLAAGKMAKHIVAKSLDLNEDDKLDVPTSFDNTWGERGYTARDGVGTAIAEPTGQIMDSCYKNSNCRECYVMEQKRLEGKISFIEYVEWYTKHEPNCLLNHEGSSGVSTANSFPSYLLVQIFNKITFVDTYIFKREVKC